MPHGNGGILMRLLVVSDIHGREEKLERALDAQPTARTVFFLGDGLRETQTVADRHPERTFFCVPGNCDFAVGLPAAGLELCGGRRIFYTHGHRYGVKGGLTALSLAAAERQAQIVLFGHTHVPYECYEDGVWYFNPGSLGYDDRYGYVDLVGDGVLTNVVRLR